MRSKLLTVLLAGCVLAPGCAARSRPRVPDVPPAKAGAGGEAGALIASMALQLLGTPYRNGGSDTGGFDCSGLVQFVFARQGVALPRSVRDQYQAGSPVPRAGLLPGDLVFFATTARSPTHVGIVVSEDSFVHAPSDGGVVRVERLSGDYWTRRYLGARRIAMPPAQP